jgi:hypothetical protein
MGTASARFGKGLGAIRAGLKKKSFWFGANAPPQPSAQSRARPLEAVVSVKAVTLGAADCIEISAYSNRLRRYHPQARCHLEIILVCIAGAAGIRTLHTACSLRPEWGVTRKHLPMRCLGPSQESLSRGQLLRASRPRHRWHWRARRFELVALVYRFSTAHDEHDLVRV